MIGNPGLQKYSSVAVETADIYTIAAGVATIQQCFCILAAQAGTADDLDTITLGSNFGGVGTYRPMVILQADTGDTITVKHNTGNIFLFGAADVVLTGNQILTLFYNGTRWMDSATSIATGMSSWTLAGDAGTPQAITNGNTATIAGGTGLSSTAGATDTVTINLDNTTVTPGSYTNADITVDAQGRLTAAASGSATPWRTDSNVVNLVTDTDTVTIGSATAGGKLFIDGDADEVQLQVQANGTQSNYLALFEDSAANAQIAFTGNGGAIFNEEGNDADFRVETDGSANTLFVDGGNNNVGINTNAPDSDVIFDVVSTTKASRPFPTMDSTQRDAIATPATASVIYNSTTTQYEYWDGAAWVALSGSSSTILDDVNGFRLTPTTATPVVASNVTNATSIYLTPYLHNLISLYNGSSAWETLASAEITISLSGLTADTNYDVFVYNNAGTVTVDTLTAWTNATTRATALVRQDGRLVKSGATTRRYVGTIRISAVTGELDWIPMPSAAQGSLSIWNMQNRVLIPFRVFDPVDSYSYGTATWRQANANTNNQMNVVVGLAESLIDISLNVIAVPVTSNAAAAIGEDSTTARATENTGIIVSFLQGGNATSFAKIVPVGYHYYAWLEIGNGGSVTWFGDLGTPDVGQSGMTGKFAC